MVYGPKNQSLNALGHGEQASPATEAIWMATDDMEFCEAVGARWGSASKENILAL